MIMRFSGCMIVFILGYYCVLKNKIWWWWCFAIDPWTATTMGRTRTHTHTHTHTHKQWLMTTRQPVAWPVWPIIWPASHISRQPAVSCVSTLRRRRRPADLRPSERPSCNAGDSRAADYRRRPETPVNCRPLLWPKRRGRCRRFWPHPAACNGASASTLLPIPRMRSSVVVS